MPGLDGLAAAAAIADQAPDCRVLILTTFGRTGYLRRAMEAGALGFVVKDAPAEQLADAVRRVRRGRARRRPRARRRDAGRRPVAAHRPRARRAGRRPRRRDRRRHRDRLFLSEGTVRNYLSSAISKTGTRNRLEAIKEAESSGWL